MGKHVYVERANPDAKGYESGTRRYNNVISRYSWANRYAKGITIDMPCGMGWGTSCINSLKVKKLIGIDICPEAIEKAKSFVPASLHSNIHFEVGNMLDTSFLSDYADVVICCEGYEHVKREDQYKLMGEIHRIVKSQGTILLTIPILRFKGDYTGNKFHLYEPTFEEVKKTLRGRFTIQEFTKPNVARYVLRAIK